MRFNHFTIIRDVSILTKDGESAEDEPPQGCRIRGFFRIFQDFARRTVRTLTLLNNAWPPELGILNNVHSGGVVSGPE